ncbi:transcriptional regulator LldR [Alcaligenaceae bacterium 429]|uniref:transcriptional regulator LldR n=1 Tax=Paenalcaligenes sp. Me52 TaxID=3392038 RepID=UPI0010921230|nr:transcriptional regulator LldR [Alcaligenaceae bacterium 429]
MSTPLRLSDQIAQQIQQLILDQQLKPGERLPAERVLAAQLNVSRPPIREAIRTLASQGLLATRPGGGTFVLSPIQDWPEKNLLPLAQLVVADPAYNYDMLEARYALESSTAWYAALRATDQDKDNIQRCFDSMVNYQQQGDAEQSSRADARFHMSIAEASHNIVLIQFMRGLFDVLLSVVSQSRNTMFQSSQPNVLKNLTHQHESLMNAILAGDPEQAKHAISQHLHYVQDTIRENDDNLARRQRLTRFSLPDPLL